MTACTESDCGGAIAADGYCNTCGAKPDPAGAASSRTGWPGTAASPGATASPGTAASPGAASAAAATSPPASQPHAHPPPAHRSGEAGGPSIGSVCGRNGCTGTVAADGYCDTCGLAPATESAGGSAGSGDSGSGAAAAAPAAMIADPVSHEAVSWGAPPRAPRAYFKR